MKEITRINHYGLRVTSLDTARDFYQQLGFAFIEGPVGPEPVAIMQHDCGITLNLILNVSHSDVKNILMDHPEKYPGYTHIALEVVDLDAVEQQLITLAVPITAGPHTVPGGARLLFIRDPDHNVIEFHQPAK